MEVDRVSTTREMQVALTLMYEPAVLRQLFPFLNRIEAQCPHCEAENAFQGGSQALVGRCWSCHEQFVLDWSGVGEE